MPWRSKKPGLLELVCQGNGGFTAGRAMETAWSGSNGRERTIVPCKADHRLLTKAARRDAANRRAKKAKKRERAWPALTDKA